MCSLHPHRSLDPPPPASTYMLKVDVSLAGDVVDNIPDLLLSAAADEVLLRSSVLQKDKQLKLYAGRQRLPSHSGRQADRQPSTVFPANPHQHADVHWQVDLPPAAVVRRRSQTRRDSLSFSDVTGGVVRVHVFNS